MTLSTYLQIITLNVNRLNVPIKKSQSDLMNFFKKISTYMLPTRDSLGLTENEEMKTDIPCKWN